MELLIKYPVRVNDICKDIFIFKITVLASYDLVDWLNS